jgi:hypothetical protein
MEIHRTALLSYEASIRPIFIFADSPKSGRPEAIDQKAG